MDKYAQVFENNRRWVAGHNARDPGFFARLAAEQHPDFLFIGCSDSRVPANEIMGLEPGDVFVHRNIANLVVNTDINCQAVIQYAVEILHVKYIVVCGHYGCGGVKAAMQSTDLGLLNGWLREVRDVYRLHSGKLEAIDDTEERHRRLVQLSVQEQCRNVVKTSWVQRHYLQHGYPTVHGWVYDLAEGLLVDLGIPFAETLADVRVLYRLDP